MGMFPKFTERTLAMGDKKFPPTLDVQINVSTQVTLLYDQGRTGISKDNKAWYKHGVEKDGTEYTFFSPNENVYQDLNAFRKGDEVVICKHERKNEQTGKRFFDWTVTQALFERDGSEVKEPNRPPAPNDDLDEYRKYRKNALYAAYIDVLEVRYEILKLNPEWEKFFDAYVMEKLAVTLLIDFQKRS